MTEAEALRKMVAPGAHKPTKWMGGVIQIWTTRTCDQSCYNCTQGSNLGGKPGMITLEQFRTACKSLKGYFGVVGMFGGNPATHPQFKELCAIMREEIPYEHRGVWSNNPITLENAREMAKTFNPAYSNLNVHMNAEAFKLFKQGWPQCNPVGLHGDSRHAPVHLAMKDVIADEGKRWELISGCDLNQYWSAMIGVFRGEVRAWFCEVAGAQAMLHQDDPDYPDTGLDVTQRYDLNNKRPVERGHQWWTFPMSAFKEQVRKHCHECGVPLRGYGELALSSSPESKEQTSKTHEDIYKPKRKGRKVEVVSDLMQLGTSRVKRVIDYIQNGAK